MASENELRVNTPFSDPFGDQISLMILLTDNVYTVTDQGYTLWNLQMHGANLTDKKSQRFKNLMAILDKNNAELTDNETIQIKGSKDELPQIINDLTQTLIQVSDLIYLTRKNTRKIFWEDVTSYFESQKESFSFLRGMSMQGQTQLKYNIDYIFNLTVKERKFVNVYNNLSKNIVEQLIGIWADTIDYRTSHKQEDVPLSIIVPEIPSNQQKYVDNLARHRIDVIPFDDKKVITSKLAIKS